MDLRAPNKLWHAVLADESGATSMEYAMIAGGLAVFVFLAVGTLSPEITAFYQAVADKFKALMGASGV